MNSHKDKLLFVGLGIIATLLIVGSYVYVSFKPEPSDFASNPGIPEAQPNDPGLSVEAYQDAVSPILDDLAVSHDVENALGEAVAALEPLRVSEAVAQDHLLLYRSLDTWQRDLRTNAPRDQIKTQLEIFSEHQPWAAGALATLIDQYL